MGAHIDGKLCSCGAYTVGSNDFSEDDSPAGNYCSYYCRLFYTQHNGVKVRASASKHHKGIKVFPKIDHPCDYCGTITQITYKEAQGGSGRFCSRDCYFTMCRSRRKVKPRWAILKTLSQRGPLFGKDIAYAMGRWEYRGSVRQVASMLIPYVAKGIVGLLPDGKYTLLDKRPVGYLAAHE